MNYIKKKLNSAIEFRNRHTMVSYYICYTIIFTLMSVLVFSVFYINRKSFVYKGDGIEQNLNALVYYGNYLRGILKELFINHKFELPMWDMNIGYGSDIITVLHYYVIGDPLNLLSVFVPADYTELLYIALVMLRIYLSGIAFSCYSLSHKNKHFPIILGALAFCFSGYVFFAGIRHPYFLNPMIYLPFILIGIDKIYKREKPFIFITFTAIAAVSSFYFFYMICIFIIIYAVFRYFMCFKTVKLKEIWLWIIKFTFFFLISLGISCIIFMPVTMTLLLSKRMGVEDYVPFLYNLRYYERLFTGFIEIEHTDYWNDMGYSPIVLLSVLVLFLKRKKYLHLKLGFILLTIFLCVPLAGHIINGFSYVTNRWIWAYSMLNCYILVKMYPEFLILSKKEKILLILSVTVYASCCLIFRNTNSVNGFGALIILILTSNAVIIYNKDLVSSLLMKGILFFSTCIGIFWVSNALYAINRNNYIDSFQSLMVWKGIMLSDTPSNAVQEIGDNSIFRYDQLETGERYNISIQKKLNSTNFYFSLANGAISEYFEELYLNFPMEQRYSSLDGRTILDTLASVKYFIIPDGKDYLLPFNYSGQAVNTVRVNNKDFSAYEGTNILPFGYTYNTYISRENYLNMSPVEKQQALLQGCVLEYSTFAEKIPVFTDSMIEYTVEDNNGIILKDNCFRVTKANASITLTFNGQKESETYIIFENLDYNGIHPRDLYTQKAWNKLTEYEKNKIITKTKYWTEAINYNIKLKSDNVTKTLFSKTKKNAQYGGRHNYLVNLGYDINAKLAVTLSFSTIGEYTFDHMKIICQSVNTFNDSIDALQENVLQDIKLSTNTIEGIIELNEPKILLFSIPYSKGFRIFVDGEQKELKQANTMFMAVELEAGYHNIYLTYTTPYIKAGLIITLVSITLFVILIIYYKKRNDAVPIDHIKGLGFK